VGYLAFLQNQEKNLSNRVSAILPVFINLTVHVRFVFVFAACFWPGESSAKKTKNIFAKTKSGRLAANVSKIFAWLAIDGKFYSCEMIPSGRAKRQRSEVGQPVAPLLGTTNYAPQSGSSSIPPSEMLDRRGSLL